MVVVVVCAILICLMWIFRAGLKCAFEMCENFLKCSQGIYFFIFSIIPNSSGFYINFFLQFNNFYQKLIASFSSLSFQIVHLNFKLLNNWTAIIKYYYEQS